VLAFIEEVLKSHLRECRSPIEAGISAPAPMTGASDDEQQRRLEVLLLDATSCARDACSSMRLSRKPVDELSGGARVAVSWPIR
jgi:hypothetical protein